MALNEDNQTPCCIRAYGEGTLLLKDETLITRSVIINEKQRVIEWRPRSIEELLPEDFDLILDQKPNIVLLGTGPTFQFQSAKTLAPLHNRRIGVECMDTGAACRSFVALFAESRNVLAALII